MVTDVYNEYEKSPSEQSSYLCHQHLRFRLERSSYTRVIGAESFLADGLCPLAQEQGINVHALYDWRNKQKPFEEQRI